jgi:tryptophan synthase beta chain
MMTGSAAAAARGRFGEFGGRYVAPSLLPVLRRLEVAFETAWIDRAFRHLLSSNLKNYAARPTLLYFAEGTTRRIGGAHVYLKREDLTSAGGYHINSVMGLALLAHHMGMRHLVTDTGSGDHGVATAAVTARLGLRCTIFMGHADMLAQPLMVRKMRLFGADVQAVHSGDATLHEAISASIQFWMAHEETCLYVSGGPIGPHPYPLMIREFQALLGDEVRRQILQEEGRLPSAVVAALDGGGAAIGLFSAFLQDPNVQLVVASAGGGCPETQNSALLNGRPGVLHGAKTMVLQDDDGQVRRTSSMARGLVYSAVGPELAYLKSAGRLESVAVGDEDAVNALRQLARDEGILVSVEAAHAIACANSIAAGLPSNESVVAVIASGGEKDLEARALLS